MATKQELEDQVAEHEATIAALKEQLEAVVGSDAAVAEFVPDPSMACIEAAGTGSVFTKERGGWRVQYVKNGVALFISGPTIHEALDAHGLHRLHDSLGNEHGQSVTSEVIGQPVG